MQVQCCAGCVYIEKSSEECVFACRRSGNLGSKPNKHVSPLTFQPGLCVSYCHSHDLALDSQGSALVFYIFHGSLPYNWHAIVQDPFKRAEIWLRHRKSAKIEESAIWKSLMVTVRSSLVLLRMLLYTALFESRGLVRCNTSGAGCHVG